MTDGDVLLSNTLSSLELRLRAAAEVDATDNATPSSPLGSGEHRRRKLSYTRRKPIARVFLLDNNASSVPRSEVEASKQRV